MSANNKFVDNVGRRKWDLAEYEKKAAERRREIESKARTDKGGSARNQLVRYKALEAPQMQLQLASNVGTYQVITNATAIEDRGGFYCDVCDVLLKDSLSFMNHTTGKHHQRKLGMSMLTKQATLDDVRAELKKLEEEQSKKEAAKAEIRNKKLRYEEKRRLKDLDDYTYDDNEDEEAEEDNNNNNNNNNKSLKRKRKKSEDDNKSHRKRNKRRKSSKLDDNDSNNEHSDQSKSSKKKKKKSMKHKKQSKKKKKKKKLSNSNEDSENSNDHNDDDEEQDSQAQAMAQLMGFSSFGSSKK